MPEGLPSVAEFSPRVIACAPHRDCLVSAGVPSDALHRIEREIRGLEQEIAFLDVLCRSYEQCFAPSDDWVRIDVLDSTVDPPQVLFEIPTKTKLLGSAEALARALYARRHEQGRPRDLVRVRYDDKTVFIYSYLNHVGGSNA